MKFTRNIVLYLLYSSNLLPLGHVHGRERFVSSREMHGEGSLAVAAVATASKSSNDATVVLASLTPPHLTHNGDGSKNQGPLRQHHRHPRRHQHHHRHLQNELDWNQIGNDINGKAAYDLFGSSVAMSADGRHIAVGAIELDISGPGYVRIFKRVDNSWEQVGNTLTGEAAGDGFGSSVAMSADGSRVIVGAGLNDFGRGRVLVFGQPTTSSSDWIQIGNDIHGQAFADLFGGSVAMSADGSRIAVGAIGNDGMRGSVQVFGQPTTGSDWIQIGNSIIGEAENDWSGSSMSMSADGSCIVVGAPLRDNENGIDSGYVRVFDEPTTGSDWIQVGNGIIGEAENVWFGLSVAMSADGSRIAVGAPYDNDNIGIVRIFQRVNDSWEQIGNDIDGRATGDRFGWSVAMSADGSRVAVGAILINNGSGVVQVFDQPIGNGSSWIQIGTDIDAEAEGGEFGYSVAMSADGATLAVGAPRNDGNGEDSGRVKMVEYTSVEEPECPLVHCDFATLQVARFMSNEEQKQRILQDCGIISITADKNGVPRNVNVFDSFDIKGMEKKFDPHLGSPNRRCPFKGQRRGHGGHGRGGGPESDYPNCVPQGNLLIIQANNYGENTPNDALHGGCMYIKFQNEVNLFNMGLLDMQDPMTITVIDSEANETVFTNPDNIGDNGFWNVRKTEPRFGVNNTVEIKVCLLGSGALSNLDYFACLPH